MLPAETVVVTAIAATLPFVICIFVALNKNTRAKELNDYFVFSRSMDMDSFLKSSVGYSLQVAAIALFLTWTFSYGVRSIFVCFAWGMGYWLVGELIKRGVLNKFIDENNESGADNQPATIHGYIGQHLDNINSTKKYVTVAIVSAASIIGLGGTMLTEIYYGTRFFYGAMDIPNPSLPLLTTAHVCILFFGLVYILWGGFKSSVYIDRFQTPLAYLAFGLFGISIAIASKFTQSGYASFVVTIFLGAIYILLIINRYRLSDLHHRSRYNKIVTAVTFYPLIGFAAGSVLYLSGAHGSLDILYINAWPAVEAPLGFGILGAISLGVANGIWQMIDISSLQRLQAVELKEDKHYHSKLTEGFRVVGIEAGLGWAVLVSVALLLKINGFSLIDDDPTKIPNQLLSKGGIYNFLLPVFIFSLVVFMISTVSCFISALSYISFHDLLRVDKISIDANEDQGNRLTKARITTIGIVVVLYALYALLTSDMPQSDIGAVLYAIYAFQLAITPSVFAALFSREPVSYVACMLSTALGLFVAWVSATTPFPDWIAAYMSKSSWYLMPPLAVIISTSIIFAAISFVHVLILPHLLAKKIQDK